MLPATIRPSAVYLWRSWSWSSSGLAPKGPQGLHAFCARPVAPAWAHSRPDEVTQVYSHGGDVMRFAGDSVICAFLPTAEEAERGDGGLAAATRAP